MNIKGVYYGVASNIAGNMLMLIATLWLTRIMSPEEFGIFRVGSNFSVLMIPFLALGIERLISRYIQSQSNYRHSVASALITSAALVCTGIMLLAASFTILSEHIFNNNLPASIYYASIAIMPFTIAYNIANTIWRHVDDPAQAQIDLNFTQRIIRAPLLVACTLAIPSALSASLAMLAAQAISLFRTRKKYNQFIGQRKITLKKSIKINSRQLLSIGIPVALLASVDRLDVLLVNAVLGASKAGSYDLIFMLAMTAMFPAMALSKTTEPYLRGLSSDADKQKKLKQLQTRAFIISCVALALISLLTPILAKHLGNAGPDFTQSALILSTGIACSTAFGPTFEYLQINNKTLLALIITISLLLAFLGFKYYAATRGSMIAIAGLAGLFYFTLRLSMAIYIRATDKIMLANPITIAISTTIYAIAAIYNAHTYLI
ncbi:lipopolysaccharide biosynthesis protein [Brachymonas sp. J145]|uniref:lipopolysaccharide biosynthesis protein n=1 Tax=Brachymonas sp. J145 TaxID=3116489 RepID=UPI002E762A88|nr:oligosaccharide flippase family protein [Brachymonas sp. J145]MEE1653410.1 oligosaccharide flippase family protein [Brachymonas sp. J145]